MTPDLPELPFIPESNELRIRLLAWGRQCVMQERERCAQLVKLLNNGMRDKVRDELAFQIRKEPK